MRIYKLITFVLLFFTFYSITKAQEICNNGIDDDGDFLIDLNDSIECTCNTFIGNPNSLIPNPSFEEYNCLPNSVSQLSCSDTWEQATGATSDYFLNLNGGFCPAIIPQPFPDGNAVAGFIITNVLGNNYLEYIGACLTSPMQAGVSYTLQINLLGSSWDGSSMEGVNYGAVDIVLYGSGMCPIWPIAESWYCPIGYTDWSVLGSVSYTADETWQTIMITFTPTTNINAIMIGGPCQVPSSLNTNGPPDAFPYFWIDNLLLTTSNTYNVISKTGNFCTNNLVLSANIQLPYSNCQWYLNNVALEGEINDTLNVSELGLSSGQYKLQVTWPDNSCTIYEFNLNPPVSTLPLMEASTTNGCFPLEVQFTNITNPTSTTCLWTFGDGSTSTQFNPSHTYTSPGTYSVNLTITFSNGCTFDTSYQNYISVTEIPLTNILIFPYFGCSPLYLEFNELVLPDSASFLWNFGDGDTSTSINPIHTYLSEGNYNVDVSIIYSNGCAFDTTFQNLVTVFEPDTPNFAISPISGCPPLSVDFNNLNSTNTISSSWIFGDGNYSDTFNPNHTYTNSGVYSVIYSETDVNGCTLDTTFLNLVNVLDLPLSNFLITSANICPGDSVVFNNTNSSDALACLWTFGDGNNSNLCNATNIYSSSGTFDVNYSITHSNGCTFDTTFQDLITVNRINFPNFVISPVNGCMPLNVNFNTPNSSNIVSNSWNFGDGDSSDFFNPIHLYKFPGEFDVVFSVLDSNGCRYDSTFLNLIKVNNSPISNFDVTPSSGCSPLEINISNNSQNSNSFILNMGDGSEFNLSTFNSFVHIYSDSIEDKNYTIKLIAQTNEFCSDTASFEIFTNLCIGDPEIIYPNIFTPNSDGINDLFYLKTKNLKFIRLSIFDRWGNLVFEEESNDPLKNNPKWDASTNGKKANDGVFYFMYTAIALTGENLSGKGFFQLLDH